MRSRPENQPLLLIYILHKDAEPAQQQNPVNPRYVDLFDGYQNREHVVGLGIALPDSSSITAEETRSYYHAGELILSNHQKIKHILRQLDMLHNLKTSLVCSHHD